MIFDDKEIARLRKGGIKVLAADGSALVPKATGKSEIEHLKDISRVLNQILDRPEPKAGEAPKVTVNTPAVTVSTPAPIRKWRFSLSRDGDGRLKEIIATAM
jgi:hypothetical protein